MKTKKLFLMATMLLMSVCSFAQNSNTPLKGDVNGDGKVDVADIVAILKIMKDAGVTQYTVTYHSNGGNSTPASQTVNAGETVTLAGAISRNADSSYIYEFSHWNTNSSDTGTSYNAGQTITINNNIDLYAQWDKTAITPVTTDYYWYAGQTQPSNMSSNPTVDNINFTVNKWHTLNSDQISQTITGGTAGNSWYVAVPTIKGFSAYASDLVTPNTAWSKISTITVNSISYDVWKPASTGAKMNIYMK